MTVTISARLRGLALNLFLAVLMLFFIFPVAWIVLTGFRNPIEVNAFPPVWIPHSINLKGFEKLLLPQNPFASGSVVSFLDYLRNSVVIASVSTVLALALGSLAAFGFSRWRGRSSNAVFISLLMTRAIPGVALSIPLVVLFTDLGLGDSAGELILTYTVINVPLATFLLDGFFREIPEEVYDAAVIDGAGLLQTFLRIGLPLIRPGLAAAGMLAFLTSWNEFQIASVLEKTTASITLPRGLFDFTTLMTVDWQAMSAMATLMVIPPAIFVIVAQRYLIKGLILGAGR
jgi:multiple sugar transport system permease protein